MNDHGWTLLETALGPLGVAWSPRGLTRVQLPEATPEATAKRLAGAGPRVPPEDAPEPIRRALESLRAHLADGGDDLSGVPVDDSRWTPFQRRVFSRARSVGAGSTVSYQGLAEGVGAPGASRAVGQAMATNPLPLVVPCHRVLGARRALHGFSAHGGADAKARLLGREARFLAARQGLSTGYDPAEALGWLREADPSLARWMDRVGPLKLTVDRTVTPYESLLRAVVYQQLTGKAAATILGRVKDLFGGGTPAPGALASEDPKRLRAAGLSQAKTAALQDLGRRAHEGSLPDAEHLAHLEDDEVVERLTAVRGVGRWTVEMYLLFGLGRPDVLPVKDYGVKKGFGRAFLRGRLPTDEELVARASRWRPYRSVASWYLWRINDV
ncbi:MAG: methylated-DNA--[protein]-cysteine S-methyltransferase [Deltaproteobacteria bacterium]|nr:methylated-DNA--[protein]-cysteine S-methyltransferase [Deltaproteobacteria bacterium]